MVSIIIINYFSENYILKCLESLLTFHTSEDLELIIVNNGGDLKQIEEKFPDVSIIQSGGNIGFSKANNIGTLHAKGDFILFLNPDTYFISPVINTCVSKLNKDPKIGILGCRLLNEDLSLQNSYHEGDMVFKKLWYRNPLAIKFFNGSEKAKKTMNEISNLHQANHEARWLTGAFMLMRKNDIVQKKLFWDEQFFMYWEDVELSYRVRSIGQKVVYHKDAELIHIGGSGENVSLARFSMLEDAKLYFIQKTMGKFFKNLYFSLIKLELRLEYFLVKRKGNNQKELSSTFQSELDYYGIS